ncbi:MULTISPECIES: AAA family ATPase [Kitasatospora]|uniref:AAA family ATPase n=1 Tax=Kitasatospora TaxID=2063 RepID=UPI0033FEF305
MRFAVIDHADQSGIGPLDADALLVREDGDDVGFRTLFTLFLLVAGARVEVGTVKIGQVPSSREPVTTLPGRFTMLNERFFSVGQDDSYYERLRRLSGEDRETVLVALRDMAFDEAIAEAAMAHEVTRSSLLRGIRLATVEGQWRRIARGGVRRASFNIAFEPPARPGADPVHLRFRVEAGSQPPSNVHALTGRNGVGKSFLLSHLARAVAAPEPDPALGRVIEYGRQGRSFANLVTVSFSAFDEFPLVEGDELFPATYVGLRVRTAGSPRFKTPHALRRDFRESIEACLTRERAPRWIAALRTLDYPGSGFLDEGWVEDFQVTASARSRGHKARSLFRGLSSGHKIVLLTMTRLIEHVDERTLVIIDEPEAHLHPPLLAAFMRALSDLLADRNGLAVVATHSPVVLQEIPAHCVWKLRRYGRHLGADRPRIETYGENVGVLTHEVFGLEVTGAGFLRELRRLVEEGLDYDDVLEHFGDRLGSEARLVLSALLNVRDESREA